MCLLRVSSSWCVFNQMVFVSTKLVNLYVHVYTYSYIYIYIYIHYVYIYIFIYLFSERERERDRYRCVLINAACREFREPGPRHFSARRLCGSFAENRADLRRLTFSPATWTTSIGRFAETTNPRKNCADKCQNPGSWNSSVSSPQREGRPRTEAVRFQRGRCNLHLSRNAAIIMIIIIITVYYYY